MTDTQEREFRAAIGAASQIKPAKIAFIGDSITADYGEVNGTFYKERAASFANWVEFFLFGRATSIMRSTVYSEPHFGYSGFKIHQIRGTTITDYTLRTQAQILGSNSPLSTMIGRIANQDAVVVELSGANDLADTVTYTAAQVALRRKLLWQEMIVCGVNPENILAVAMLPYNDAAGTTFGAAINAINILDAAELGINWVAYPSVMLSAGAPAAAYFRDNIHPNKLGAKELGQAVAAALDDMVREERFELPPSSDTRWLNSNPYVTGSSAISGTRYTGNAATNWTVASSGGTDHETTLSKVTDSEGEWQRFVVTGTNRDSGISLSNTVSPNIPGGTKFRIVARVKGSGFQYVQVSAIINSVAEAFVMGPGVDLLAVNPNDLGSFDGVFVSPVMVMPGGVRSTALWVSPKGQGTLDIRQVGILRDDDPVLFNDVGNPQGSMVATGSPPAFSGAVMCNATAGAITVNLPAMAGVLGRRYSFVKTDSSGNAVTLDGNSSETINGSATLALSAQWDRATIEATSTGWVRVD
jgi:lysophospholipase L1-like esterase